MQARSGARRRHIEQAPGLDVLGIAFETAHVFIGGIFRRTRLAYRREQEGLFRQRLPDDERRIAVTLPAIEPRHDDGVELQPFRLVHGHDFDCIVTGIHVRQRINSGEALRQRAVRGKIARIVFVRQHVEENFGVFEFGGIAAARRPAECQPHAFDAIAQIAAQAMRAGRIEHAAHAFEPAARVVIEQCNALRIVHRFP